MYCILTSTLRPLRDSACACAWFFAKSSSRLRFASRSQSISFLSTVFRILQFNVMSASNWKAQILNLCCVSFGYGVLQSESLRLRLTKLVSYVLHCWLWPWVRALPGCQYSAVFRLVAVSGRLTMTMKAPNYHTIWSCDLKPSTHPMPGQSLHQTS